MPKPNPEHPLQDDDDYYTSVYELPSWDLPGRKPAFRLKFRPKKSRSGSR